MRDPNGQTNQDQGTEKVQMKAPGRLPYMLGNDASLYHRSARSDPKDRRTINPIGSLIDQYEAAWSIK